VSGFASLTWEQWRATTKLAKKRQREECLLWMNQIWENTRRSDWPEEWTHLRTAVREDTFWSACNTSEREWKGESLPPLGIRIKIKEKGEPWEWKYKSWVENNVLSRVAERAQVWLRLCGDAVDWNRAVELPRTLRVDGESHETIIEPNKTVWLTHALKNDWSNEDLQTVSECAKANGWSWENIPKDAWPRIFFLNAVVEWGAFDDAWLLNILEVEVPSILSAAFSNNEISSWTWSKIEQSNSPFLIHVYWTHNDSGSNSNNNALHFWADRVHQVPLNHLEMVESLYQERVIKKLNELHPTAKRGWAHLLSAIEKTKLDTRLIQPSAPTKPMSAL
jgi:hypothetical protein